VDLPLATRQLVHSADVCLAICVAAESTCCWEELRSVSDWQATWMASRARPNWLWSTRPGRPATEVGSETPIR